MGVVLKTTSGRSLVGRFYYDGNEFVGWNVDGIIVPQRLFQWTKVRVGVPLAGAHPVSTFSQSTLDSQRKQNPSVVGSK